MKKKIYIIPEIRMHKLGCKNLCAGSIEGETSTGSSDIPEEGNNQEGAGAKSAWGLEW